MTRSLGSLGLLLLLVLGAGCDAVSDDPSSAAATHRRINQMTPAPAPSSTAAEPKPLPPKVSAAPSWLGTRVLPRSPEGFGLATHTPKLLRDRRFVTVDFLAPPRSSAFRSSISQVPRPVVRRSTWSRRCPVSLKDLAYLKMTFWGFDHRPHTGEMIVNEAVAGDIVEVFRRLYGARWPIEEMRVTDAPELDAPPTGDGNNTSAFVCRPARLSQEWSEHAYGLAVDVNPFHNPYVRGDLVLPELAIAYADRARGRPGMIQAGDVVTEAFSVIGWGWGGSWSMSKDWMHFSRSGG